MIANSEMIITRTEMLPAAHHLSTANSEMIIGAHHLTFANSEMIFGENHLTIAKTEMMIGGNHLTICKSEMIDAYRITKSREAFHKLVILKGSLARDSYRMTRRP